MAYETKSVEVMNTNGSLTTLIMPATIPSNNRADTLRRLYSTHVKHEDHWKGPAWASVPADIVDDVAEAMDFMGSIVDERETLDDGNIILYSRGYWAHGF